MQIHMRVYTDMHKRAKHLNVSINTSLLFIIYYFRTWEVLVNYYETYIALLTIIRIFRHSFFATIVFLRRNDLKKSSDVFIDIFQSLSRAFANFS